MNLNNLSIHPPPLSSNMITSSSSHPFDNPPRNQSLQSTNVQSNSNTFKANYRTNSFTCCYFNSRSLVNKLDKFQSFVYSSEYNIICVTETWLADFIFDQEILPSGYTIFRKDRSSRGGGVLVAVSDTIPASVVPSHTLHACPSHKDLEILSILLKFEKNQILLCCVYISPNVNDIYLANNISCLSQTIHSHSKSSNISSIPSITIGDFNLPDIQWDTLTSSSPNSRSFCDFVFDNALVQLIHEPTHTKGNILDLVLTNDNDLVSNATVNLSNHHLSTDHYLISFKLSHPVQPSLQVQASSRYVLDYPKANYDAICSYLLDYDFTSCLQ